MKKLFFISVIALTTFVSGNLYAAEDCTTDEPQKRGTTTISNACRAQGVVYERTAGKTTITVPTNNSSRNYDDRTSDINVRATGSGTDKSMDSRMSDHDGRTDIINETTGVRYDISHSDDANVDIQCYPRGKK